ncbi:hypothetical protein ACWFMI_27340 [Nocardiopsis terrae]
MVPPNTTATGRAPARGRRPEDAPRLSAVPSAPAPGPGRAAAAAATAGLPEELAGAVLGAQAAPKAAPKAPADRPAEPVQESRSEAAAPPAPASERDQEPEPAGVSTSTDTPEVPPETAKEGALVAVEPQGRSAVEAERAIHWLGVTFRPPDVWRERQPSLKEEWLFVMDGSHLPEQGVWRAAARGYAAPAIALISGLHFLIWVLRSPARHATVWAVAALVAVSAALML